MWPLWFFCLMAVSHSLKIKNIGTTVDTLISLVKSQSDYMPLPEFSRNITLGITLWKFEVKGGRVGHLSTLYRDGNASMTTTPNRTTISAKFGMRKFEVGIKEFDLFFLGMLTGNVSVACDDVEVDARITITKKGKTCTPTTEKTAVSADWSSCKINLLGIPFADLFNINAELMISLFENEVSKIISELLAKYMDSAIQATQINMLCMMIGIDEDDEEDDKLFE